MIQTHRFPMSLRRFRFPVLPTAFILLLFSVRCAFTQPAEMPTGEDRATASHYSALVAELIATDSLARELINERDPERVQAYLDALNSKKDIGQIELGRARRFMRRILPQLEELKTLASPAPYAVAKRQGMIKLDGKLQEPEWQQATAMPIQYRRLEKVPGEPAMVRLLWDETYLYAAFEVPDANIIAPLLERDGEIWMTDCVELFLVPDRKLLDYWEIEISASGSIYDSTARKYTDRWGSAMQVEKSMNGLQFAIDLRGTLDKDDDRDAGYSVEIAIPFKELPNFPQNPKVGDQLYALLCRVDRIDSRSRTTTPLAQVPWVSWFHNIWAYQPLILSAPGEQREE